MRISGFIAGSLVGIAAGLYLFRKRPEAVNRIVQSADNMLSGAKNKLIEGALTRKFGREQSASGQTDSGSSKDTIRSLINADDRVKHEVDQIMNEAGETTH